MINIGSKKRETNKKPKKEGFMQGVITLMFSQVLNKNFRISIYIIFNK